MRELIGNIGIFLFVICLPLSVIFSLTPIGKVFVSFLRKKLNTDLISNLESENAELHGKLLEYEEEIEQLKESLTFYEKHKILDSNKKSINLEKNL